MARGYPDFFGRSIYPKYGVLQRHEAAFMGILPGATQTILNVTAQGTTGPSYLYATGIGDLSLLVPICYIDGARLTYRSIAVMVSENNSKGEDYVFFLRRWEPASHKVYVYLTPYINFTGSYRVDLWNQSAANVDCDMYFNYYSVT